MHQRKKQTERFLPGTTQPNKAPSWRLKGQKRAGSFNEDSTTTKKQKYTQDEMDRLYNELPKQFKKRVSEKVIEAISGKKDLQAIKSKIKEGTPRGVLAAAEQELDMESGTLDKLLKKKKEKAFDLWTKFVDSHFDDEVQLSKEISKPESSKPKKKTKISESESFTEQDDEHEDINRSCRTNIDLVIRNDLPMDIKAHLLNTLKSAIVDSSNYIIDFNVMVLKIITLLQTNTFVKDGVTIKLVEKRGPNVASILPEYLCPGSDNIFLAPFQMQDIYTDKELKKSFDYLLTDQNFQHLHSNYFGSGGIKAETMTKFPFLKALIDKLPKQNESSKDTDQYMMKLKLSQYMVNFKNMYADRKRIHKTLSRLITYLLEAHLMQTKTKIGINELEKTKKSTPKKINKKTRSSKRRTIKREYRTLVSLQERDDFYESLYGRANINISKLKQKQQQLEARIGKSWNRIGYIKQIFNKKQVEVAPSLQQEVDTEHKVQTQQDDSLKDMSRSRLKILVKVTMDILFDKNKNKCKNQENDVRKQYRFLSELECQTIQKITNFLADYVPDKENWIKPIYQIPFLLMANKLMRFIKKRCRLTKVVPHVKLNGLQHLTVDSPMLYSLFSTATSSTPVNFFDYSGNVIPNRSVATEKKDAMMGSLFDLEKVHIACKKYQMAFCNLVTFAPNSKQVIMHGCKKIKKGTKVEKDVVHEAQKPEAARTETNLEEAKKAKLAECERLNSRLKEATKERKAHLLKYDIRSIKNNWFGRVISNPETEALREKKTSRKRRKSKKKNPNKVEEALSRYQVQQNNETYQKIKAIKIEQKRITNNLFSIKKLITRSKNELKQIKHDLKDFNYWTEDTTFVENIGDFQLDKDLLFSNRLVLSGTDNGLVKMTDTVRMTFERYVFHLYLYVQSVKNTDMNLVYNKIKHSVFLTPPQTLSINARCVKYFFGGYNEEAKRNASKNLLINTPLKEYEDEMSNTNSIFQSFTVEDIERIYSTAMEYRNQSRDFYYSSKRIQQGIHRNYQKKWAQQNICNQERMFISKTNAISMFIGDRGYCIGSTIKGHVKYGGPWKMKEHSYHVPVYNTNENNTSQTCIFCFEKIDYQYYTKGTSIKRNNGVFVCLNETCVGNLHGVKMYPRDSISAMAIVISGLSYELFGLPMPVFDPQPSVEKEKLFLEKAEKFLQEHKFD